MRPVRILLAESVLEDAQFLRGALDEIQESARFGAWTSFEITHVEALEDVCTVAMTAACDIVLLDLNLQGATSALQCFAAVHSAAASLPLILLIKPGDEPLARRLLRDGAQDYLLRSEIDCDPLARAIHNAIERQRHVQALRHGSSFDELTGLFNERGFRPAAQRELRLAAKAGLPVLLAFIKIDNFAEINNECDRDQRALTLVDASVVIGDSVGDDVLLAYLGEGRFAALAWDTQPDDLTARLRTGLAAQLRHYGFAYGWSVVHPGASPSLDSLVKTVEAALCENEQSYHATEPSLSTQATASAIAFQA